MNVTETLKLFAAKLNTPAGLPKTSGDDVVNGVIGLTYWTAGIVAVIVIIVAGIMFASSNGDPGKAKTARNMVLYTVIGLVFIIFAISIVGFVSGKIE